MFRAQAQSLLFSIGVLGSVVLFTACLGGGQDTIAPELLFSEKLGGETTAFSAGSNAFELSARNLTNEERRTFEIGDSFFNQNWVTAPASTEARDGLGPTFNAQSCSSCHSHDGRAKPPDADDDPVRGLLLRLSIPGPNGPIDEPNYGDQLQDRAILGVQPEGRILIRYDFIHGQYPDGESYSLRKPRYIIAEPAYGPLHEQLMVSPRIAPQTIGMGLLEAIREDDILAQADPDDVDGDGISGRPNMVWDIGLQSYVLGRFGWKANQPTVEQQSAGAFLGDIGITSSYFPHENCTAAQTACQARPNGGRRRCPMNVWARSRSMCRRLPCRRCAMWTTLKSVMALSSLQERAAHPATHLDTRRQTIFPFNRCAARLYSPTRICCSTTWEKALRTTGLMPRPTGGSGVLRRSGA